MILLINILAVIVQLHVLEILVILISLSYSFPYSLFMNLCKKLLYSRTNIDGGGLDITSGLYTSNCPGTYLISWSLRAKNKAGGHPVIIYLRKNSSGILQTEHWSSYDGETGQVMDMGTLQNFS